LKCAGGYVYQKAFAQAIFCAYTFTNARENQSELRNMASQRKKSTANLKNKRDRLIYNDFFW